VSAQAQGDLLYTVGYENVRRREDPHYIYHHSPANYLANPTHSRDRDALMKSFRV
jgi:hypothetical protein